MKDKSREKTEILKGKLLFSCILGITIVLLNLLTTACGYIIVLIFSNSVSGEPIFYKQFILETISVGVVLQAPGVIRFGGIF